MLKIRLSMGGAKKRPIYKIVIADSRFPRDGRFIEKVGFFNPLLPKTKKERVNLEVERIKHWISKDAPTTESSRIIYENDEIGVAHYFISFKEGARQAVLVVYIIKDGKIICSETGATNLPKK